MSNPRPKLKGITPVKRATPETRFYIDYDWWEKSDLDLKTYLYSRLNIEEGSLDAASMNEIDIISPETGMVRRVDSFQYVIQSYFSQLPDDFLTRASLVDAVFCIILANANEPMSALDIAERVQRTPKVVLKTIGGPKIYQGIRPVQE
jgi:hypothetical protein